MTYGDGLFARYYAEHSLPAGYRRVEYLESTGEQWIDTGLDNLTDVTHKMQIKWIKTTGHAQFIGQGNGWFFGITASLNWRIPTVDAAGIPASVIPLARLDKWYDVTFHRTTDDASITVGSDSLTETGARASSGENLWLFAISGSGNTPFRCCCAISYTQLYGNGTLVRSYVPCVRIADSKPGMYDLCGSICPLTNSPF
jgi:hypothetical protein